MPFNTQLSDRIREKLSGLDGEVVEKHMFGGICFMVNGKMCAGVVKDAMMCRIGPSAYDSALEEPGCREMRFTGKPMKGYVFVDAPALSTQKALNKWLDLCLAFNSEAKASAKKRGRRLSGRKTG